MMITPLLISQVILPHAINQAAVRLVAHRPIGQLTADMAEVYPAGDLQKIRGVQVMQSLFLQDEGAKTATEGTRTHTHPGGPARITMLLASRNLPRLEEKYLKTLRASVNVNASVIMDGNPAEFSVSAELATAQARPIPTKALQPLAV